MSEPYDSLVYASPSYRPVETTAQAIQDAQDAADAASAQFPVNLATNTTGLLPTAQLPLGVPQLIASGAILGSTDVGSGTTTINVAMPAGTIMSAIRVKTSTVFSGNAITSATVSAGVSGLLDVFILDYNLLSAVSATNLAINSGAATGFSAMLQPTTATYNAIFTFTTDQNPTAGQLDYQIYGIKTA